MSSILLKSTEYVHALNMHTNIARLSSLVLLLILCLDKLHLMKGTFGEPASCSITISGENISSVAVS